MFATLRGALYTVLLYNVYLTSSVWVTAGLVLSFLFIEYLSWQMKESTKLLLQAKDKLTELLDVAKASNQAKLQSMMGGMPMGGGMGFESYPFTDDEEELVKDIKILDKNCPREKHLEFLTKRCSNKEFDFSHYSDQILYGIARGLISAVEKFNAEGGNTFSSFTGNDDNWSDVIE